MRRSLLDIADMVRQIPYPKPLPEELRHLHCYISDSGHCILAIPKLFASKLGNDPQLYEVPLPVRYVLETGWEALPDCDSIVVEVEYDDTFGARVPEKYEEW